jgi:hypothetical protein
VQISLWGGRRVSSHERWEYYGYGPDLPPLPSVERLSDAEYRAWRRKGRWMASIEIAIVVGIAVAVGVITRSLVAVFVAAALIPCLVMGVGVVVSAVVGMRRLRATSLPAEPPGGRDSAKRRPDEQGGPVVERR